MNRPKNINISQQNRRIDSEEKLVKYIRTQLGEPLITVDVTDEQIKLNIDDAFRKFADWAYNAQQSQVFVIQTMSGVRDYVLDDRVQAILGCSVGSDLGSSGGSGGGSLGMWGGMPMGNFMPPMYVPATDAFGNQSQLASTGMFNNFCTFSASAAGVAGGITGPNTGGSAVSSEGIEAAYAMMANMETMQSMFGQHISYDFNSQNNILRFFEDINGPVAIEAALYYIPSPSFDLAYGHTWIKEYALNLVKRTWGQNIGKYSSPLVGGAELNYDRIISEAQTELDRLNEDLLEKYSEPLGIFSA